MNRIESKFAEIRDASRKALVPFVTAGDPAGARGLHFPPPSRPVAE